MINIYPKIVETTALLHLKLITSTMKIEDIMS